MMKRCNVAFPGFGNFGFLKTKSALPRTIRAFYIEGFLRHPTIHRQAMSASSQSVSQPRANYPLELPNLV